MKKYFWDIDPEDADHPSIHGLRTGILARAEAGYDVDQIANDIGMSRQNVEHYMRFRDQMKVATDGQRRLKLVSRGLDREPNHRYIAFAAAEVSQTLQDPFVARHLRKHQQKQRLIWGMV